MRVTLFTPDYGTKHSCAYKVTMALSEGLTSIGVEHTVSRCRDWQGEIADIAIINGWTKKMLEGRPGRNRVIAAQAAAGKPAWCIERGFLLDRELWSAMSIGGFCSSGGDFRAEGMPSDRWEKMGIELKPWRTGGDYILLCAQVPWDAQVDDGNHLAWLEKTAREIRKYTDRPIKFRGHPKAYQRRTKPYAGMTFPGIESPSKSTDLEDLAGAHAVVCYNSNMATLATVAGVPVFTGADCLADPIAFRTLTCIDHTHVINREQWAYDLAYKQWHLEEFREALPWKHLMR